MKEPTAGLQQKDFRAHWRQKCGNKSVINVCLPGSMPHWQIVFSVHSVFPLTRLPVHSIPNFQICFRKWKICLFLFSIISMRQILDLSCWTAVTYSKNLSIFQLSLQTIFSWFILDWVVAWLYKAQILA